VCDLDARMGAATRQQTHGSSGRDGTAAALAARARPGVNEKPDKRRGRAGGCARSGGQRRRAELERILISEVESRGPLRQDRTGISSRGRISTFRPTCARESRSRV